MLTYKEAGVDIDKKLRFQAMIKQRIETQWQGGGKEIDRYAGRGLIPAGAKRIEVSTDGTGTKILVALLAGLLEGIGQDVVAMGVGDLYAAGVTPYYLVDTLKVACLEPEKHIKIIESIIRACVMANCRLIGGETAQLRDMFKYPWMVDLDVTAVGFPNPDLEHTQLALNQLVYGWPSHGPASNGFTLLRKVFDLALNDDFLQPLKERWGWKGSTSAVRKKLERYWPELKSTLAQALLVPTPIWISRIEEARRSGMKFVGNAHITGGGMLENIPRIMRGNEKVKVVIDRSRWQRPPIFRLAQEVGKIANEEMDKVFNQGIMVVSIMSASSKVLNPSAILIGQVEKRKPNEPQVMLVGKYNDA